MNKIIAFVLCVLMVSSCADEDLGPIITFDTSLKGAYVRLLSEGARDINLFDIGGSAYTYSIEFIDAEDGGLVSEYGIDVTFRDNDPTNGDNSTGPFRFRTYSSSEFGSSPNGKTGLDNITISANDLLAAAGIAGDDLSAGDVFQVAGSITLTDGSVFGASNSSAAVNGSAFQGHFDFDLAASCPTSLDGTYDAVVIDSWCGDTDPYNTTVTFTLTASGYDIDDFSFGAFDVCYNGRTVADPGSLPLGNLRMVDICNTISITGASQWGEITTWHSLVADGNELTVEWTNDYGEGGTTVITNPSGWPPLTL